MNLERMKQIAARRTKGQWEADKYTVTPRYSDQKIHCRSSGYGFTDESEANAAFIAMVANEWDRLIEALETRCE